jgi:3-hydroxypropanoate dehydrogenase
MPDSAFRPPLPDVALDQLYRQARTYNAFSGEVSDALLHQLFVLV